MYYDSRVLLVEGCIIQHQQLKYQRTRELRPELHENGDMEDWIHIWGLNEGESLRG